MPGEDTLLCRVVTEWLGKHKLRITAAGEFDDAALMAAFGREMVGAFPIPSVLAEEYAAASDFVILGQAEKARIE